eukprot:3514168-Pleurochrysis_carterae.AAC.1
MPKTRHASQPSQRKPERRSAACRPRSAALWARLTPLPDSNARGAPQAHEEPLVQILREELLVCTTSSSLGKSGRGALRLREELF